MRRELKDETPLLISKSRAAHLLDMDPRGIDKLPLRQVQLSVRKVRLRYAEVMALVERRTFAK